MKNEKQVVSTTKQKTEMVTLFKTTYYYWRYWLKQILANGKVKKACFVKDEIGYTGKIAVQKSETDAAKKVLADYKLKNPDTIDMWY